jgi:UDP-3-O-[3-hydroxymyristoyl] glucosamine N-acyltransferase
LPPKLVLLVLQKIGKNGMIGGQVGIAGHLTIGNNVRIQAQSGVGRNIKDDEICKEVNTLVTMILANHMFISRICSKLLQN